MKTKAFRKKTFPLLLAMSLLCACSLKLMYQNADWMLIWRIDDYFDLNFQQRSFLEEKIQNQLLWHRRHELPLYSTLLRQLQQKSRDGLTASEIDWVYENFYRLRKNIVRQIATDSAFFLSQLQESQIRNLESELAELNKSFQASLEQSPEERLQDRANEIFEFMEDWIGPLSADQKRQITDLSRSVPDTLEARYHFRLQRQGEFIALLRSDSGATTIEARLLEWYLDVEAGYPPEYRQFVLEGRKHTKAMIFAIDKLLSPRQRQHFNEKIEGILEDIASLSDA